MGIERRVDETDLPLSTALGVLDINGVTAHYGLLQLGRPQPGDTVVVSTAAGSVGSCVGQIARVKGCRTVGITGGPQPSWALTLRLTPKRPTLKHVWPRRARAVLTSTLTTPPGLSATR